MTNNKYLILAAVVLLQACIGGTYSWSIYDAEFIQNYQVDPVYSTMPFNVFYVVFPLTLLFSHRIISRFGTRMSAQIGIALFACGWLLSNFGDVNFIFTIIGVGVIGGIGVGLTYLVPILVGIAWFPDRGGLITGLAVGGFAAGAALVGEFSNYLIYIAEFTPFTALAVVGGLYFVVGFIPATLMYRPMTAYHQSKETFHINLSDLLKDPLFLGLFIAMTVGLTAGFFVNSKIVLIAGNGFESFISLVAVFALCNAIGRVAWGAMSDIISVSNCLKANLLLQAISIFSLLWLFNFESSPLVLAALAGFNYGGVLVLYASRVRQKWGENALTKVYSWLFLSNIVAAIVNSFLSGIFSNSGAESVAIILTVILVVGFVGLFYRRKLVSITS
ncbi:MFS transporter [Vibrio sp. F74]|uniref:MFS transporter n=1 Tax=Vibrio sp. F74 TaxID=700020 RepID=UPI0035F5DDC2